MIDRFFESLRETIRDARRILVITHIRPDGDAIGSLLGFGLALQGAGKEVQMALEDTVPPNLRHLPGSGQITQKPTGNFDLVAVVDCSDRMRMGRILDEAIQPDINIDHHPTNENYARINLVNTQAVSTSEILANFLPRWDLSIDKNIASALLTGLITDTIGFRTPNVSVDTMRIVASLMEHGAELSELYMRSLVTRSFEAMRLWGAGLTHMQRDGAIVWTSLTREDRLSVGYPGRDDADLINMLSAIKDAQVSIIFVEQPNGSVKVSWRAQPGVDVAQVALSFGGGGHTVAAGAEIVGDLNGVQADVLQETRNMLSKSLIPSNP